MAINFCVSPSRQLFQGTFLGKLQLFQTTFTTRCNFLAQRCSLDMLFRCPHYDKLIYDNLVYIISGGRRAVEPLSDIFPINFPAAKLYLLPLEAILSPEFALFLRNRDINIDAGDFNCYNMGEEWRDYTANGGIRLCLFNFRLKTIAQSKIVQSSVLQHQRISPWSLICCTQMKKGRFYLLLLFTERTLPVKVMCCTH